MNAVTEVMDELRKALAELEDCRARNADLRTMLEQVTRERDEARASCHDCAMYAERSARWHDDMQRAERERDEARAEVEHAYREGGALYEAKIAEREAFRSGAEAMREACAREIVEGRQNSHEGMMQWFEDIASDVRDLPIPEEP